MNEIERKELRDKHCEALDAICGTCGLSWNEECREGDHEARIKFDEPQGVCENCGDGFDTPWPCDVIKVLDATEMWYKS